MSYWLGMCIWAAFFVILISVCTSQLEKNITNWQKKVDELQREDRKRTEEETWQRECEAFVRWLREEESYVNAGQQSPPPSYEPQTQQWWQVLGVSRDASVEAIKAAYRKAAMTSHPDTAPNGKGDVERFLQINKAYKRALG